MGPLSVIHHWWLHHTHPEWMGPIYNLQLTESLGCHRLSCLLWVLSDDICPSVMKKGRQLIVLGRQWSWVPDHSTDGKSTLVKVMAWCHQATSHYLSQCWPTPGYLFWGWDQIFCEKRVNTIAADALVTCKAKSSVTMVINMQYKWPPVFHKEGLLLPVPSQCWAMIENANKSLFSLINSVWQGLREWPCHTVAQWVSEWLSLTAFLEQRTARSI